MSAVLQTIRILVIIQIIKNVSCQDGFSEQDLLRLQQLASNDGQVETITSYSTNIIQRDPNAQSISSVSVRYHTTDPDKNEGYNRADRSRNRKVYRIKNPFQRPEEGEERNQDNTQEAQDSNVSASNQYAAMQYSLPPDEFLQQMRERENHYYQQQQQQQQQQPQQQLSTQASNLGYTATPQPQYQYSTIAPVTYDNQQPSQVPQLEPKMSQGSTYLANTNYQYGGENLFGLDSFQSTPSPITSFLSTSLPTQFVGTSSNSYVSSSSPIYLSSPPNFQQYVSSPISTVTSGTSDYGNNRVTTTIGSHSYSYDNNNNLGKKMQIDHYDNSANGIRYPMNVQQYQQEYPRSTPAPSSSPYSEQVRDNWSNSIGTNTMQKSLQDYAVNQYHNAYNNQDARSESKSENTNSNTHRIGNTLPTANNVFLNLVQGEYQLTNNARSRTRDVDQETAQPAYYSHGDYGWKMPTKKTGSTNQDSYPGNYQRYQSLQQPQGYSNSDGAAISQMSFQMDAGRQGYDQISKSSPETLDPQEFAKAAAKAQEKQQQEQQQLQTQQQQQLYGNSYLSSYGNNNYLDTSQAYNDKQRNKYGESPNSYPYNNLQNDLITAAPYFYANSKENYDNKPKQPFDHDKALQNIVPIDVSNVVSNSDSQTKVTGLENNKYLQSIGKDQNDQGLKQYYRSITDAYYKDKNAIYGFNIKSKPEEYLPSDNIKQVDNVSPYYTKSQTLDSLYNQGQNNYKRYLDGSSQTANYMSQFQNYQDSQASANIHSLQRPGNQLSDVTNILKLNDVPHRLTQGLSADSLRLNNFEQSPLPTPLPIRLNQNVGTHQLDVANNILNKFLLNKQPNHNLNRPEIDSQAGGLISTINGFKVANPFNVDLKLVTDMLKGKPAIDDSHLLGMRDPLNKPIPLKFDISQLQQLLLKTDNSAYSSLGDAITDLGSPYLEIYGPGRYPYQGVKYSRSQEEEESIVPIADASNTHPIGAVIEEGDAASVRESITGTELTAQEDEAMPSSFVEDRPKTSYGPRPSDRLRHPNGLMQGRHSYQRKHPKSDVDEPYPLLKPPPPHSSRSRTSRNKYEKHGRRRRLPKPKMLRVMKSEPLFEAGSEPENEEPSLQTVLRPPSLIAEAKVDLDSDDLETPLDS